MNVDDSVKFRYFPPGEIFVAPGGHNKVPLWKFNQEFNK